jgi:replicative DNA helicase
VFMPESGVYTPIRDLEGRAGFEVLAIDTETWRLEPRRVRRAFATGRKPVFLLRTRLGRTIRATANHKFLAFDGWRRLDDMAPGMRIAVPRRLPSPGEATMTASELALLGHLIGDGCTLPSHAIQYTTNDWHLAGMVANLASAVFGDAVEPRVRSERSCFQVNLAAAESLPYSKRNPVAAWLDGLGVIGLRSWEKRVPDAVFAQPADGIAAFLRHIWATDGCMWARSGRDYPVIRFHSSSERLIRDVQSLLLRLGRTAIVREVSIGAEGRPLFRLLVTNGPDIETFLSTAAGAGTRRAEERVAIRTRVGTSRPNMSRDTGIVRERAARVAAVVESDELRALASRDVYWDEIVAIERDGDEDVYDLTVEGLHSFVADDVVVHNSIEQDSDVVMFVYRDEYYNDESDQQGLAEVIVAKHRNGPTDAIKLSFLKRYAKFADLAA